MPSEKVKRMQKKAAEAARKAKLLNKKAKQIQKQLKRARRRRGTILAQAARRGRLKQRTLR